MFLKVVLIVAGALFSAVASAERFVSFSLEAQTDVASIRQVANGLEGPQIESGDFAFLQAQFEAGWSEGVREFFIFQRVTQLYELDDMTAQVLDAANNDRSLPVGTYPLALSVNAIQAYGFGVGETVEFDDQLAMSARLSGLMANRVTYGELSGSVVSDGSSLGGDLSVDYLYSKDMLLDRTPEDVTGYGVTLDFGVDWRVADGYRLSVQAKDLLSQIWWDDVTYTTADATSNVFVFDGASLQTFPGIQGVESNADRKQRLPRQLSVDNVFALGPAASMSIRPRWIGDHFIPSIGLDGNCFEVACGVRYHSRTGALELDFESEAVSVGFGVDSVEPREASALFANFGLRF